ncbi:MAG: hypothetical protein HY910_04200 [Desulfarculus sp.]|nr:hypothetical protein [Desulfarculus sp.]
MQDCYIKIGEEHHQGLEAAALLEGIRHKKAIEICFQGCPEQDRKAMLALYYKWRQDSNQWTRYRPLVLAGLALLLVVIAYFSGYWQQIVTGLTPAWDPNPSPSEGSLFADQASLYTFLATIAAVLGIAVWFLRSLARREAGVGPDGLKLKDNEASRRLAKDYDLSLDGERLLMSPRGK